jgi:hypothetical protein
MLSYEAKISTCILLFCHFLQAGTLGMGSSGGAPISESLVAV